MVDQCLDLVGRPFMAKEAQNDADGFFGDSILYSGFCSQLPDQFVHLPRLNRLFTGPISLALHLDLPINELQAILPQ
jgi:hypothetical protein